MAANAIPGPWPAQERILVCLNESPAARDAIRVAKRSADRARADWIALSVVSDRTQSLSEADKDQIAASLRLAERLGAELATLTAEHDVAAEILDFARRRNVRRIILGRPRRASPIARLLRENVSRNLLRQGGDFEITITPQAEAAPRPMRGPALPKSFDLQPYVMALLAVVLASGLAWPVDAFFPVASLSLIYMTAVIAVAARYGQGPQSPRPGSDSSRTTSSSPNRASPSRSRARARC